MGFSLHRLKKPENILGMVDQPSFPEYARTGRLALILSATVPSALKGLHVIGDRWTLALMLALFGIGWTQMITHHKKRLAAQRK
jgi:hypothetical protein